MGVFDEMGDTAEFIMLMGRFRRGEPDWGQKSGPAEKSGYRGPPDPKGNFKKLLI